MAGSFVSAIQVIGTNVKALPEATYDEEEEEQTIDPIVFGPLYDDDPDPTPALIWKQIQVLHTNNTPEVQRTVKYVGDDHACVIISLEILG